MELVTIRTFNDYFSANVTLTKLQAYGLECYLKDENTVTIDPLLTNAIGGIKLAVKEKDETEARILLKQFDVEYMEATACPKCGAHDFSYIGKPGVTNFVTAILTKLISNYTVPEDYVYKCGNCGYETQSLSQTIFEE
ncbi:MAG TPA: hypothetical protein VK718_08325 [Ferruginibacter sp.]|jgi:hypothetical protein|nr:hypothetical protein [Ferruginibacter sp.]